MIRLHGTAIFWEGRGILLRGAPGSGKSDLALRCLDHGAVLVADDQVEILAREGALLARPPAALAGRLEVRGIGLCAVPHRAETGLDLLVDLVAREAVARLPEPARERICGIELPLWRLAPFEASAPAKLRRLALGGPDAPA
ncbi:MAG: serine/threonine protein kinase [Alphaproteobacteria bacterium]|nr:serine/threonine protein kinase [Alphaproteobacteria bacterium]